MDAAAIELRGLEKRQGTFRLGPLDLAVPRGVIFALIGPNGAGKTTLLDLLMGMGRPDRGTIRMLGRELAHDEVEIKRRTAYVNPDLDYRPWKTVGRAIDFTRGFYRDWDEARCARLLPDFALGRDDAVATLSFGSRIKLGLVLALARDAELLLLDEPTVGLDAPSRQQLFAALRAFMRRDGVSIVISSHQLADIERLADHVAIINRGKLVATSRMDALLGRYRQLAVRGDDAFPWADGLRILGSEGDRRRLLVDRSHLTADGLAALETATIAEIPMTLEELFLALIDEGEGVVTGAETP